MKKRTIIMFSALTIAALLSVTIVVMRSKAGPATLHTHSVWTNDDPVSIRDAESGCQYTDIEKFRTITSWTEEGPPLYPAIAHFRGFAVAHNRRLLCGDHDFEFRLLDASTSTDKEVIDGTWDVYRDGTLMCSACHGRAYDLDAAVSSQYSVDVDDPVYGTATWQYYGYVDSRFDF